MLIFRYHLLQLEYMRPEHLPENRGGRPPPESPSTPEPEPQEYPSSVEPIGSQEPSVSPDRPDLAVTDEITHENPAPTDSEQSDFDKKAQLAIQHFEQWVRNRHPELNDEQVQTQLD